MNIIREKREELKLTQADLAKLTGISRSQIAAVETGLNGVSVSTAHKLAAVLGVEWSEIIENLYSKRSI